MKLSIIIPVYNMEKYIEKCLGSIFTNRNIDKEFEVICIDDGSKDASVKKIYEFKEKYYDKLTVISIRNSGVSNARNIGLENSGGEYVTFVDSDDWVSEDYLDIIFKSIEENGESDLFIFNTVFYGTEEKVKKERVTDTIYNTENHVCCKVFKNKLIKENKLKFPVEIKLAEDMVFTFKYIYLIDSYTYVDKSIYFYRCDREGSTMTSEINSVYKQIFYACDELYKYYKEMNINFAKIQELEYLFIKNIIIRNTPKIIKGNKKIKNIINEIEEEIEYIEEKFPDWINNKYIRNNADKYCSEKLGDDYKKVLLNFRNKKYLKVMFYFIKGKLLRR